MKKTTIAMGMLLALTSSVAMAHQAGDIIVRSGPILVVPDASTSNYAGNALEYNFNVNSNAQLGLTGTYMITDNIGVELLAATPFSHEIKLANLGNKVIAKTKQLPPTLYAQYYFGDKNAKAHPYLGAGVNYTTFFGEKEKLDGLTDLKLDDSWGVAFNAGIDIDLTDNLMFNTSMWYAKIKSKATFKLNGTEQKADVKLDPMVFFMGIGYRF